VILFHRLENPALRKTRFSAIAVVLSSSPALPVCHLLNDKNKAALGGWLGFVRHLMDDKL
jgi:hypothetical protein